MNPAPYSILILDLLGGGDELTIPSRTVKLLHPINAHIDGYQEAQRTPKAGNDNEAVNQAPPAHRRILSCRFCFFITVTNSPEANSSEGVQ
jgi:hypothetical protein